MKHLTTFKLWESRNDRGEIFSTIEDLILDFERRGFKTILDQDPGIPSIFKKTEKDDRRINLNVWKDGNVSFSLSEIEDEILHILSLAKALGWGLSLTADFVGNHHSGIKIAGYKEGKFIDQWGSEVPEVTSVYLRVIPKE